MNNKIVVAIISLISIAVFCMLAQYGWTHRYGAPKTREPVGPKSVAVAYDSTDLALESADLTNPVWQKLETADVNLFHQVSEKPWPTGTTPSVAVQAFHNGKEIYFRLTWQDDAPNNTLSLDNFADGCAVAMPIDSTAPLRSIMMGFSSPVNIWHWKADKDAGFWDNKKYESPASDNADFRYPFEEEEVLSVVAPKMTSAVTDLLAARAGSLTPKESQIVQGRGAWTDGNWTVVLKRTLATEDTQRDCQFAAGQRQASFAIWDGDQADRGSRKSISDWVDLRIAAPSAAADSGRSPPTKTGPVSLLDRLTSLKLLNSAYANASADETPAKEPRVIEIIAKRFEYVPNRISVKKGDVITLKMESLDVTHGLYVDGYGVNIKARPGLIGTATFVADKTGRFTFRCSETCGEFHPYMIGFLEVTPNSRFRIFLAMMCIAFVIILVIIPRPAGQRKEPEHNAQAQ